MKEWNELYRDLLSAYNALGEAIATAKTLHERNTRRIAELEPVTDDDPTPLQRVIIETNDGADVGWRLPEIPDYWITRRGRSYLTEEIHGFIKLPPPQE